MNATAIREVLRHARRLRDSSLLRNSGFSMGITVVTAGAGYLYWIAAARLYPSAAVGLGAALISGTVLAANLSTIGLGPALVQWLPQARDDRSWSEMLNAALLVAGGIGVVAGVILALVLPLASPRFHAVLGHPLYALAVAASVPCWSVGQALDFAFLAERVVSRGLLRNVLMAALKPGLLFALLPLVGTSALAIVLSTLVAGAASLLIAIGVMIPRLRHGYRPFHARPIQSFEALLRSVAAHHLSMLGGTAPMYLLPVIITARISPSANAYFYTTWMVGSIFFMISTSIGSALFAEGANERESLRASVWVSARAVMLILPPALVGTAIFGRHVLAGFGAAYARHGFTLLMILAIASVPDAVTNIYVAVLRSEARLREAASLNLAMGVICIGLAWYLLPTLGLGGAGLAWLGGQAAGSLFVLIRTFVYPPTGARTPGRTPEPVARPFGAGE